MILSNLHTHTSYCDGKNPPEEMVLSAINKGFSSLGFSGHAYTPHDDSYCMSPEKTQNYIKEINLLKEKYNDKIEIYLGCECDLYSEIEREKYDYIIGSVHYAEAPDGTLCTVDHSKDGFIDFTKSYFGGDYLKFAKAYYGGVSKLVSIKPDIIGHLDLINKFNEGNLFFDQTAKAYLDMAFDTIDALLPHCDLFEINTGAISRGYNTIYPSLPLLKRLREKNARITLTSDCHNADFLDCSYNESVERLKAAGFKSAFLMLGGKFIEQPL